MKRKDLSAFRPFVVMLLSAIVTVVAILLLYYYDNQYTLKSKQPYKGKLELTKEELDEQPLCSLINGWEFYPGLLLEPEDFENGAVTEKPVIMSLGWFRQREGEETTRWTNGTFRLRIILPDDGEVYGVKIPESTAEGCVYMDGHMVLNMGKNWNNQSTFLSVSSRRHLQILIQVADSGPVRNRLFPTILFGRFESVRKVHDYQLLLRTVILVLTAGAMGLSLHLALKIKWWRGYLFSLFCLSFLGYAVWLLVQTETTLTIQPWFTIRIFSFHIMLWLAVILENDLYRIKGGKVSAVLGTFSILSLIYGCYVQYVPAFVSDIYFYISEWYKYAVAFYLILVADVAVVERMERSQLLLAMGTSFAAILFMEQLLTYYEPIIGGTFLVGGCMVLFTGMFCILWNDMVDAFRARTVFVYETESMSKQMSMQRDNYQQLNARIEETRRLRHDMRHHLNLLYALAEKGDMGQIREYLMQLLPTIEMKEKLAYTKNHALDAILCHYAARARQEEIEFKCRVSLPEKTVLPDDELCVMFGNLLENAVEACSRQKEGKRFIDLCCLQDETKFSVVVDNSYEGKVRYREGYFHSSKRDGVGIGVESVKEIVRRHGGMASFEPEEGIFRVSILLTFRLRSDK